MEDYQCPHCGKILTLDDIEKCIGSDNYNDPQEDTYESKCPYCNKDILVFKVITVDFSIDRCD